MILKNTYFLFLSIIFSILLSACGGGSGGTSSGSNTAPTALISVADQLVEGTTFIDLDASNSSDGDGNVASYDWRIDDDDGFSNIEISDPSSPTTQIIGLPAVISEDIFITVSLAVTDDDGASSDRVSQTIVIVNNVSQVDISDFNGIWFSPCFNNRFGFSARQTLNINGNSLISDITSFTAAENPARNCVTPSNGETIFSDATADLSYGIDVSESACLNGRGVDTDIDITSVSSGGSTFTNSNEIDDALNLVTGFRNILPNDSTICRTPNGDLIFGGSVYTRGPNTNNIDVIDADLNSDVSWQAGNSVYFGGVSSSDTTNTGFGVVVAGTDQDTANGNFSGSSITITHSLSGSGLYQVRDTFDSTLDNQIVFDVIVGTATTSATSYNSVNAINNVEVIVDEDGDYHFTLSSPIFLERGIEVNGGVSGAPETIDFTMNNIFDFSN